MLPATVDRVPAHTTEAINEKIWEDTQARVRHYAANPSRIEQRLRELDREWDIERVLETNASALAFAGTVLGITRDARWLALPVVVTAFLFQHAVQGWCPPVPVLRRLGVRTAHEIETERAALKSLRGDFRSIETSSDVDQRAQAAMHAARI